MNKKERLHKDLWDNHRSFFVLRLRVLILIRVKKASSID